jgi:2-oxoglutarate ferredoxin oxidoreductase subunit gamma
MKNFYMDVIISGFGGQGALIIGDILAYAGMLCGFNTSFYPSYGVEMRGGTANCMVVITSGELYSPVMGNVENLIALNQDSIDAFLKRVKEKGAVFINSSLVKWNGQRKDVEVYEIPASVIAEKIGVPKSANMVVLGAFVGFKKVIPEEKVETAINIYFSGKEDVVKANVRAFKEGLGWAGSLKG